MVIEVLYPELGSLYGEYGNLLYLTKCCSEAEVIRTNHKSRPYFADNDVDVILASSMLERFQPTAAEALRPYLNRFRELIEKGTVVLFTGNTVDLLGEYILREEGTREEMLGLFPYHTEIKDKRINSLLLGSFEGIKVIGYKAQNAQVYGKIDHPFLKLDGGCGNNREDGNEGIHYRNLFATYMTGPLLPQNPLLMKYILRLLGRDDTLAFEEDAMAAYENSLREYEDPALSHDLIWHNV